MLHLQSNSFVLVPSASEPSQLQQVSIARMVALSKTLVGSTTVFNQAFKCTGTARTNVGLIEVSGYSQQSTGQITIGLSCTSVHGKDNVYVARFY